MTKSKYAAVAMLAGLVALLMAADASAGRGRGRGKRGAGMRATAALELTAEQQVEIHKLRAQMIEDLAPAKAKLGQLRGELRALWQADQPSKKKIIAKQAEMNAYRDKIRARKIEFRIDVLNLLTPEQRAKMNELKVKRGAERGAERGGKRGSR
jgi:Spy/CpxP family protein refolding chaperone